MRRISVVLIVLAAALLAACGGGSAGAPPTPDGSGNLFGNPGFEVGRDPWFSLKEPQFLVSEKRAHSGKSSALLFMRDPPEATGAKVYYLVQEIKPAEFPDVLRGYYYVEGWKKSTGKQYLQFVVIVFGGSNLPTDVPNHQIRYPLAGIDSPPFGISNAYFIFLGNDEPVQGQWVPFEANIKQDFQRLWGVVPKDYEKLRILFEVRWDDKTAGESAAADVYYDDLFTGPATAS